MMIMIDYKILSVYDIHMTSRSWPYCWAWLPWWWRWPPWRGQTGSRSSSWRESSSRGGCGGTAGGCTCPSRCVSALVGAHFLLLIHYSGLLNKSDDRIRVTPYKLWKYGKSNAMQWLYFYNKNYCLIRVTCCIFMVGTVHMTSCLFGSPEYTCNTRAPCLLIFRDSVCSPLLFLYYTNIRTGCPQKKVGQDLSMPYWHT